MTIQRENAGSPASATAPQRPSDPGEPPYPSVGYAWYVVAVLMIIYVFSFIDRQILGLLVEPIKRDLGINDTQMSYLMGLSFAVFYTFFGIPLGRMADSMNRTGIIAAGLALWSIMTAACGLVGNFAQFLFVRMGVGVGEAALNPSAYSLISDYFPREKLATAISVYSTGIYIGSGLAYLAGAVVIRFASGQEAYAMPVIGDIRPWQVVFFMVGVPGLLLTPLLLTVKEPFRRGLRRIRSAEGRMVAVKVPLSEVGTYIGQNWTTFLFHNLGFSLLSLAGYGAAAWLPTFMIRTHGMTPAEIGVWYGAIVMVAGTAGIIFGGAMADRLVQRGIRNGKIWGGILSGAIWLPFGVALTLVPNKWLAVALLIPSTFAASMPFGCAAAAIQEMMPASMRAQASAIYLFVINLIGLGFGPTAVALCTDYLFKDPMMIRYSMLLVGAVAQVGATIFLLLALKPYLASLQRLDQYTAAQ